MKDLVNNLRGIFKFDYPLKNLTWFKVGGNAKYFFIPKDISDLKYFLKYKPKDLDVFILGAGSNTLIRDAGVDACVIKLQNINDIKRINDFSLYVESGCLNISVSNFAKDCNISGLEFISGVPGNIGGALAMNAGCFNAEMKDIVVAVKVLDKNTLQEQEYSLSDMGFSYRHNSVDDSKIFLSVILKGVLGDKCAIAEKLLYIKEQREESQPKKVLTGGSTFANPEGDFKAWQLIDQVGLRGHKIGGAFFSDKHCNFIINDGSACAKDIEDLINLAKQKVLEKFNIYLKEEIKIIGI